jgi:hypothetical protein
MRAGESSHRPFLLCLNDPRINGSRLLLPSVFIILIHYIWFSALAFCGASNAYQRRYPHDQNISVNRFLRSFLLNPVLPQSHSSSSDSQTFSSTFFFLFVPAALRSVKIRSISVISGKVLVCLITIAFILVAPASRPFSFLCTISENPFDQCYQR